MCNSNRVVGDTWQSINVNDCTDVMSRIRLGWNQTKYIGEKATKKNRLQPLAYILHMASFQRHLSLVIRYFEMSKSREHIVTTQFNL